jgi:hypothetical protein
MKRNFVVACVLVLALALGLSATVGASVQGSAEPAAKKGTKKGKACKAKKAGKGKAGKSAAASAQKKGKGKGKGCKPKGKDTTGDKGTPAPTPPAASPFGDGAYGDVAARLSLTVSGGTTTAVLNYTPPGGCATISYTSQPATLTKSGDTWTASQTGAFSIGGQPANAKWDLTVKEPGLTYALNLTLDATLPVIGLCKWEGHPTGTLVKVG